MMVADSDVLIDYLRGHSPWAGRIRLEIATGHLATTAINSFELLSGAKSLAEQKKVSVLLSAMTVLGLSAESSERAAEARRALEMEGQGIGMADYLIAGVVSDEMCEFTKGKRPVIPLAERLESVRLDFGHLLDQIRYLVRDHRPEAAATAWDQAATVLNLPNYLPSPDNLIVNGDFSLDVLNGALHFGARPAQSAVAGPKG